MKKLLILFFAVCFLTACDKDENEELITQYFFGSGDVSGQIPQRGLVAYYPFDGDTGDKSGNSLNARISGEIYVLEGHNNESKCACLPGGIDNYMYVHFSDKLRMDEWTINLWFYYKNTVDEDGALIQMGRDKVPGSFLISMNAVYIVNSKGTTQYGTLYNDEHQYPSPNNWHMITASVKGSDVAFFFDGKVVWKDVMSAKYVNELTQNLYIGVSCWFNYLEFPFEGFIDDVRIYKRALSDKEVQSLYEN